MQVLAINSSPNRDRGNTALLLEPFLEGMRTAGAEVELVYASDLRVKPCSGEFSCWIKTPGRCIHQDDMEALLPRLARADVLVLATPVYVDGITGGMKTVLDRIIPLARPFFELREGHCRHPLRHGAVGGKLVLVSNCGFWESDNFDPLVAHMRAVSSNLGREYAGALLRPHGPALRGMLERGLPVSDVLDAAKEAGRQLVEEGGMALETLEVVGRELLPLQSYVQIVNESFKDAMAHSEANRSQRPDERAA
jgi:multimeric flavodoxin WrbA